MKTVEPLTDCYTPVSTVEQENRVITEAKQLLYQRLKKTEDVQFIRPQQTRDYLALALAEKDQEIFSALFLDSKHRLIQYRELFIGTINSCSVYPREVVKAALQINAAALIFAHNHPSGDPEPSQADRHLTERLQAALALMDIPVLDHLVVGDDRVVSFAERGLL